MLRWNKRGPAQLGTDQAKPCKEKVSLDKIKEGFFYFILFSYKLFYILFSYKYYLKKNYININKKKKRLFSSLILTYVT